MHLADELVIYAFIFIVVGQKYHLPEASCLPRPQAVKVPKVTGTITFPDYVILDRCEGGCPYTQQIAHCLVTHQDKIEVMVTKVNALGINFETVEMYNHTRCDCGCIKKPSDCDYTKHLWDSSTCTCRCIAHGSHCNPRKQVWNGQNCACECIHALVDCGRTKEWDSINCGCRCHQSLVNKCKENKKLLNSNTCKCEEPVINAL